MQTPPVHEQLPEDLLAVAGTGLLGVEAGVAADRVPPVVRVPLPPRVAGDVRHGVVVRRVRLQDAEPGETPRRVAGRCIEAGCRLSHGCAQHGRCSQTEGVCGWIRQQASSRAAHVGWRRRQHQGLRHTAGCQGGGLRGVSGTALLTVMDTWSGSVRPQCVSMMPCQISLGAQHAPAARHRFFQNVITYDCPPPPWTLHRRTATSVPASHDVMFAMGIFILLKYDCVVARQSIGVLVVTFIVV